MSAAGLDALLHAPARLQIAALLARVDEAEFAAIRDIVEVSDSVLSKHISALTSVRYIRSRKGSQLGRRTTWVGLTAPGRRALTAHVAALRAIIDEVDVTTRQANP